MRNHFLPLPQPQPTQQGNVPAAQVTDEGLKRRQCFAIVKALKVRFIQKGISENALWCWALAQRDIAFMGSRSAMSTLDWTILAARLHTAQHNATMFDNLCGEIRKQGDCRVYRIHADLSEVKVFAGVFDKKVYERCQRHADATGCTVRLHAYATVETFEPAHLMLDTNTPPIITTPRG